MRFLALALGLCALLAVPADAAINRSQWVSGVQTTEYYPAPEAWAIGAKVKAPGFDKAHRVDWLYGARGLSMEGSGVAIDGTMWHIEGLGSQGWVQRNGRATSARSGFSEGPPFWRAVGWRNARGRVTFPLDGGGWFDGVSRRFISPTGISFAPGLGKPLTYYRSVAVDPSFIRLGSWVYLPAYSRTSGGGWMRAQDTGGAVGGRHIDVFRPPTADRSLGTTRYGQRIYVVPPGRPRPARPPQ